MIIIFSIENNILIINYLIQFSGSPSQSVLHRNRSQLSHPIGGVRARPFSKQFVFGIITLTNPTNRNNLSNEIALDIVSTVVKTVAGTRIRFRFNVELSIVCDIVIMC